jgi:hypothetical protein
MIMANEQQHNVSTTGAPAWKFWHPLSFWTMLGTFALVQLVFTFIGVALREGVGLPVPQWAIAGVSSLLAYLAVVWLAAKKRAAQQKG